MQELLCQIKVQDIIDRDLLNDPDFLRVAIHNACEGAGATVLEVVDHRFDPQGYTALFLLSESHAAIHTWPEKGYALVNYFSCAPDPKIPVFLAELELAGFDVVSKQVVERLAVAPLGSFKS